MEIPERVVKWKYHILVALILCLSLSSLMFMAPRLVSLLAYFWPLFLSTGLFLGAVLLIARTSPTNSEEKTGQGLLDYVAGEPVMDIDDDTH